MESRYLTSAILPKRLSCSASRGPALVFAPFLSLRSAAKLRDLENDTLTCKYLIKVDPAETRTPLPSTFRKEYEPGSNKNRIGRKSSARRSDPARLHSSRHLGWAMVGDAKSRKCKKSIIQRIRSGRRGAQLTGAHSSPQPAQATHHVAQAQRRRQRFDLKHRK